MIMMIINDDVNMVQSGTLVVGEIIMIIMIMIMINADNNDNDHNK